MSKTISKPTLIKAIEDCDKRRPDISGKVITIQKVERFKSWRGERNQLVSLARKKWK